MDLKDLKLPFEAKDIEWRAGATNQDKTRALAMAYLTSRAVMNRLDEVVGPENWKDEYMVGPQGGVMCGISIWFEGRWVTKFDVGENSDFEPIKGGFSDAFKRAAVKWGIGRYLYNLDAVWHECEVRGKTVVLKGSPNLPAWALPAGKKPANAQTASVNSATTPVKVSVVTPNSSDISDSEQGDGEPKTKSKNGEDYASMTVPELAGRHAHYSKLARGGDAQAKATADYISGLIKSKTS